MLRSFALRSLIGLGWAVVLSFLLLGLRLRDRRPQRSAHAALVPMSTARAALRPAPSPAGHRTVATHGNGVTFMSAGFALQ